MGEKMGKKSICESFVKSMGEKYWCKKCGSNFENFVKYLGENFVKSMGEIKYMVEKNG